METTTQQLTIDKHEPPYYMRDVEPPTYVVGIIDTARPIADRYTYLCRVNHVAIGSKLWQFRTTNHVSRYTYTTRRDAIAAALEYIDTQTALPIP